MTDTNKCKRVDLHTLYYDDNRVIHCRRCDIILNDVTEEVNNG